MIIIPAIDIKNGKCVRLSQGDMAQETVYGDNPVAMAEHWISHGAKRLHLVDLDGAIAGKPVNADVICEIAKSYPDLDIQVGGGIRDKETIEHYLNIGVNYIIIGTRAVTSPDFIADVCTDFPNTIMVGLDAKNGKLATNGWAKISDQDVIEVAKQLEQNNIVAIVYTDISRDGMMNHLNIQATKELCKHINTPVIASGGVTDITDIEKIIAINDGSIYGAITGRAIYEGTLNFSEAQKMINDLTAPQ